MYPSPDATPAPSLPVPVPDPALLTQAEIDALWQGNTDSWTGLIRSVEAAVHRKLYQFARS